MSKRQQTTALVSTNISTGETHNYSSMREAASKGGFDYRRVQACIRQLAKSHAGFTFAPVGPLRPVTLVRPRIHEAAKHIEQGLTAAQVAKVMGLSKATVFVYARQARSLGVLNA